MRVLLILLGAVIYGVLHYYFGVPRWLAAIAGGVPFAISEASGLLGPYEKSAKELMHEPSESPPKDK